MTTLFAPRPSLAPLALALALAGCQSRSTNAPGPAGWYDQTRLLYFGIPVTLRFAPDDDELAGRVWRYLEHVDDVFNDYRADSELGRLNAATDRARVEVSQELADALALAFEVAGLTDGAFDVAVGRLRRVWKDAAKSGAPPSREVVASALASSRLSSVHLEGRSLTIDVPDLALDLGGIAKGIAVDRVVAMLREAGCRAALVQIGGETAAFGTSVRGRPHVIGVQHPVRLDELWTAIIDPGTGVSCATSGNYRQPVMIGGTAYYHIFDPATGLPVDTRILSVSVAFPATGKNGLADGLSTAGAVLGPERFLPLVEKLGGQALVLTGAGDDVRVSKTSGWDALVAPARQGDR